MASLVHEPQIKKDGPHLLALLLHCLDPGDVCAYHDHLILVLHMLNLGLKVELLTTLILCLEYSLACLDL